MYILESACALCAHLILLPAAYWSRVFTAQGFSVYAFACGVPLPSSTSSSLFPTPFPFLFPSIALLFLAVYTCRYRAREVDKPRTRKTTSTKMQLETARSSSKFLPEASPRSQKRPKERLLAAKSKKLPRSSSKNFRNHERLLSETSLARKKQFLGAEVIGYFTSKTSASAEGTILSCKGSLKTVPRKMREGENWTVPAATA